MIRPFEWYRLNVYHVMRSWLKLRFSRNTQKHVSILPTNPLYLLEKHVGGT